MKSIILVVILLLTTSAYARDISFLWTASTDSPSIDGYRLYYTMHPYGQTEYVDIPGQSTDNYILEGLEDGKKYRFTLTAYRDGVHSTPTDALALKAQIHTDTGTSSSLSSGTTTKIQ